jgi:hypothetical protein
VEHFGSKCAPFAPCQIATDTASVYNYGDRMPMIEIWKGKLSTTSLVRIEFAKLLA